MVGEILGKQLSAEIIWQCIAPRFRPSFTSPYLIDPHRSPSSPPPPLPPQLRPDRQTLMFSATWQRDVKQLAKGLVRDPLKVVINHADELKANKAVRQEVLIPPSKKPSKNPLEWGGLQFGVVGRPSGGVYKWGGFRLQAF